MNSDSIEQEQPNVDELLTSYLDDELSNEEREQVEARLTDDLDFRVRLNKLQRAWDMLDSLPKTELTFDFTRSTVEMVATRAGSDSGELKTIPTGRWSLILGAAAVLLSAVAGYFLVYAALDSPNRRLMSDLPMLQHLDEYRYAEDVEFIEMLDEAGLFEEEEAVDDSM